MYTEGERERSRQRWMTKSIASQPSNERERRGRRKRVGRN